MTLKSVLRQFNLVHECRKYSTPLWQCPQFLFVIMGIIIIISVIFSFVLGERYISDPQVTLLLILGLTGVLLAMAFTITQSFEKLAEANRLKTEFISIVSHQLRSPLTNLKWGLDFLITEMGERTKEEMGYFRILKENIARMQELVNDLLTVSRVDQGRFPFEEKEFDFADLVKQILGEFASVVRATNIEVKIEGKNIPKMYNDPSLVRHVLGNLIDNAVRYAWRNKTDGEREEKKGSRITIRYWEVKGSLRCEVEDNGVGIPTEDQKYIFQKFFRSTNAVRHQTQGSGLGLYIVKSLTEKVGGQIGFTSVENKGSTFWFTLPIRVRANNNQST